MNLILATLEKINGIYDIHPPVAPAASTFETILLLLIYITIISVVVYVVWRLLYSTKGQAKRKIKKLHLNYSASKVNPHDAVYQLCFMLSHGLNLKYLNKNTLLPEKLKENKQEWLDFTNRISALRYEKTDESNSDINALFIDSLHWLRIWP